MIDTEKNLQNNDCGSFEKATQPLTNLNSIDILQKRISRNREARVKFVSSQIDKGIAYQIRALRDRQDISQEELASLVGMNQNAISRLESPSYGRPTISTLKRLAAAFDVALVVRFVPFSHLVNWVSGTPFIERGLSTENMAVPSFNEELHENFEEQFSNVADGQTMTPKERFEGGKGFQQQDANDGGMYGRPKENTAAAA